MKRLFAGLMLGLILLMASWALLKPGMFRTHDYVHGARIVEMSRILEAGQVPPRWSQNFGFGYGMPLFSFYAPLPYLVGAGLYNLNFSLTTSVKLLYFITHLVTALGMYRLGKRWFGTVGGILAAGLMVLAPYRALNVYARGALSELWGLMAVPWIMLSVSNIYGKYLGKSKQLLASTTPAWVSLAFWLTVLLTSHNITALLLVPLFLSWLVLVSTRYYLKTKDLTSYFKNWWLSGLDLVKAGVLGLGLASFYVWPALLEKSLTQVDSLILGGYFDFNLHFLYIRQFFNNFWGYEGSGWGADDGISFFLGYAQLAGLLLITLLLFKKFAAWRAKKKLSSRDKKKIVLSSLLIIFSGLILLLTTFKSQTLWQVTPGMEYIQFPWRFLGMALPLIALAGASVLGFVPIKLRYPTFCLFFILMFMNAGFFRPSDNKDYTDTYYYSDPTRIREEMSGILPDYIPQTLNYENLEPAQDIIQSLPGGIKSIDRLVDKADAYLFMIDLEQPSNMVFAIADYPGWELELDGVVTSHDTTEDGLIAINLPKGKVQLGVIWTETILRQISNSISAISLIIFISLLDIWKKPDKYSRVKE